MHARKQVVEYFAEIFTAATSLPTATNRPGLIPQGQNAALDVRALEETIDADEGEIDHMLETTSRHAPITAVITMKSGDDSDTLLDAYAVAIEKAAQADHFVGGVGVEIEYAGMTYEADDELEMDVRQMTLVFRCSYRTPYDDPETLE